MDTTDIMTVDLMPLLTPVHALNAALLLSLSEMGNACLVIENKRIIYSNYALEKMSGFSTEELHSWPSFIILFHPDDRAHILDNHIRRVAGESFDAYYQTGVRHRDGHRIDVDISVARLVHPERSGVVVLLRDITKRKQAEALIQHMAQHDALTDLPNRALLTDRLEQAMINAKRDRTHLALMYLDLDNFKLINDTFGHTIGDLLLMETAQRIRGCLRASDTVARIGGDEFILLLPSIKREQDALTIAENICKALNLPFDLNANHIKTSASIGISIFPEHGDNEGALVRNADAAMYNAKKYGRNNVQIFA